MQQGRGLIIFIVLVIAFCATGIDGRYQGNDNEVDDVGVTGESRQNLRRKFDNSTDLAAANGTREGKCMIK